MKIFPTNIEEFKAELLDLFTRVKNDETCFEIVLPNGDTTSREHVLAFYQHADRDYVIDPKADSAFYFECWQSDFESAFSPEEEIVYLERGCDCSNDFDDDTPEERFLWLNIWTSADPEKRNIRYDWNVEMDCWELGSDDFPAMSNELLDVFNKVVDDELLTAYYKRQEGRVRITADGLES